MIDFKEPRFQIRVDHNIKTQDFKTTVDEGDIVLE
jgi:hypothetical protein